MKISVDSYDDNCVIISLLQTRAVYKEHRWNKTVKEATEASTKELTFRPHVPPPPPPPGSAASVASSITSVTYTNKYRPAFERQMSPHKSRKNSKGKTTLKQQTEEPSIGPPPPVRDMRTSEEIEIDEHCTFAPMVTPNPFVSERTLKKIAKAVGPGGNPPPPPPPPPKGASKAFCSPSGDGERHSPLVIMGSGGIDRELAMENEVEAIELKPGVPIYYYNAKACPPPIPPAMIPDAPPLPTWAWTGTATAPKASNKIIIVKGKKSPLPPAASEGGWGSLMSELNAKLKGTSGGVTLKKVETKVGKLSMNKKKKKKKGEGFTDLIDELAFTLAKLKRGDAAQSESESEKSEEESDAVQTKSVTKVSVVGAAADTEETPVAPVGGEAEEAKGEKERRGGKIGAHALIHEAFAPGNDPPDPSTLKEAVIRNTAKIPKAPLLPGFKESEGGVKVVKLRDEDYAAFPEPPGFVSEEKANRTIPFGYYLPSPESEIIAPGMVKLAGYIGENPSLDEAVRRRLFQLPALTAAPLPARVVRRLQHANSLPRPRESFAMRQGVDLTASVLGDGGDASLDKDDESIVSDILRDKILPADLPVPTGYNDEVERLQRNVKKRNDENMTKWKTGMRNYDSDDEVAKLCTLPADGPTIPREFKFPTARRKKDKVISFRRPPESASEAYKLPFSGFIKENSAVVNSTHSQIGDNVHLGTAYWASRLRKHDNDGSHFFQESNLDKLAEEEMRRKQEILEIEHASKVAARYNAGDPKVVSRGGCLRTYPRVPRNKVDPPRLRYDERAAMKKHKQERKHMAEEFQKEMEEQSTRRWKQTLHVKARKVAESVKREKTQSSSDSVSVHLDKDIESSSFMRSVQKASQVYRDELMESGINMRSLKDAKLDVLKWQQKRQEQQRRKDQMRRSELGECDTAFDSDNTSHVYSQQLSNDVVEEYLSDNNSKDYQEREHYTSTLHDGVVEQYMDVPTSFEFRKASYYDKSRSERRSRSTDEVVPVAARGTCNPTPLMSFETRKVNAEQSIRDDLDAKREEAKVSPPKNIPLAVRAPIRKTLAENRKKWTTSNRKIDAQASSRVRTWQYASEEGRATAVFNRRLMYSKTKGYYYQPCQIDDAGNEWAHGAADIGKSDDDISLLSNSRRQGLRHKMLFAELDSASSPRTLSQASRSQRAEMVDKLNIIQTLPTRRWSFSALDLQDTPMGQQLVFESRRTREDVLYPSRTPMSAISKLTDPRSDCSEHTGNMTDDNRSAELSLGYNFDQTSVGNESSVKERYRVPFDPKKKLTMKWALASDDEHMNPKQLEQTIMNARNALRRTQSDDMTKERRRSTSSFVPIKRMSTIQESRRNSLAVIGEPTSSNSPYTADIQDWIADRRNSFHARSIGRMPSTESANSGSVINSTPRLPSAVSCPGEPEPVTASASSGTSSAEKNAHIATKAKDQVLGAPLSPRKSLIQRRMSAHDGLQRVSPLSLQRANSEDHRSRLSVLSLQETGIAEESIREWLGDRRPVNVESTVDDFAPIGQSPMTRDIRSGSLSRHDDGSDPQLRRYGSMPPDQSPQLSPTLYHQQSEPISSSNRRRSSISVVSMQDASATGSPLHDWIRERDAAKSLAAQRAMDSRHPPVVDVSFDHLDSCPPVSRRRSSMSAVSMQGTGDVESTLQQWMEEARAAECASADDVGALVMDDIYGGSSVASSGYEMYNYYDSISRRF